MPLRLAITSYQRQRLKQAGVKEFGTQGGSIGRSLESDWVLQDGARYVSSRHAAIDFRSGSYYIIDTSSNGVYVNDEAKPVGTATPQRLFDGDRLRIGEYEMLASITETDDEFEELSDDHHIDPVDRAQFVSQPEELRYDLVSEQELNPEGVDKLLREGAEASALKEAALKAAARIRRQTEAAEQRRTEKTKPSDVAGGDHVPNVPDGDQPGTSPSVALYAFFRGACLPPRDIDEQQATFMLHRLGRFMRELLVGLTDALQIRAEQQSELHVPATNLQAKNSNVRMFSAGVGGALNTLISESAVEFESTIAATRGAFQDVNIHQEVMLGAVRAAVSEFIDRLDPDELEQSFDHGTIRNKLLGASNKKQYWNRYREVFEAMSEHSSSHFPQPFAEELSRAYAEEAACLKAKRQTDDAAKTAVTKLPQAEAG